MLEATGESFANACRRSTCIFSFSPESYLMKNKPGRSSDLLYVHRLPVLHSGMEDEQFAELTATGIVPDLHRLPY